MFPILKPFQAEALKSFEERPHTVLISATGSGKSLIFQKYLLDHKLKSRALIVTPLNALARQIANGLKEIGLSVHLGVGRKGEGPPSGSGIWIVSPEKIFGSGFSKLREWRPNVMIVDEAHCVWEWGNDFRPEFARIPSLANVLSIPKTFWCSATLPENALQRIQSEIPSLHQIGKFSLPKSLRVERVPIPAHRKLAFLQALLHSATQNRFGSDSSGMIFVSTRAAAERLQQTLRAWNVPSLFYHAGMSSEEREALEEQLRMHNPEESIWVVATSAFGMGMNYPFLKTCILFEPSLTLLALAQALGRVGRQDGPARAWVFWHENDFRNLLTLRKDDPEHARRLDEVKTWCATQDCPPKSS